MENQIKTGNLWVDRYVAEVGRMLPAATRADVELEMRSLIEEEVDARSGSTGDRAGDRVRDEIVLDVLRTFGHPQKMAARYGAQQYLIGPALYPTFLIVLRIVLAVFLGLNLFALAIAIGIEQGRPNLAEAFGGLINSLIQGGGMVVLVFALIERFNRAALDKAFAAGDGWDPRSLPEVENKTRVKTGETMVDVAFTLAALLVINVYLDQLGFYFMPDGGIHRFAVFSPEFRQYVPLLTLWWGLDLVLNVMLLLRGRWTTWLRWAHLAVQAVGVVVLVRMLTGPALAAWLPVEPAFRVTVSIILVVTLFEVGKSLVALFAHWSGPTGPTATLSAPH